MATTERRSPRVLLMDDDPAVAKALATVLRRAGYDVTVVGSAAEGENLLPLERFDAMVLDLRMPETRGDAFYYLACVKQPWLAGKALFVTGDITLQGEQLIEPTGCNFLLKPFRGDAMLAEMLLIAPIPPRLVERAG